MKNLTVLYLFAVAIFLLSGCAVVRPGEAALKVALIKPCPPGITGSLVQSGVVQPHEA